MISEGATEAGIALMHQNAADRAALPVGWYQARYLCMLAAAYARLGRTEVGLRVISEANDLLARNSEWMWSAELRRVEGELRRVKEDPIADTEACFQQALSIARDQRAKSLELRAATSLARLWQDQGRHDDAHRLLAEIYAWFSEGFDTFDLTEARLLLDDLAQRTSHGEALHLSSQRATASPKVR